MSTRSARNQIGPAAALSWMVGLSACFAGMNSWWGGICALFIALLAAGFATKTLTLLSALSWLLLPVALPLFVIHGVLNPGFPVTEHFGGLPIRSAGLSFAMLTSSRLGLIALACMLWRFVDWRHALLFLQRLGIPMWFLVPLIVANSTIDILRDRARAVYIAQQARGTSFHGNFLSRAAAFSGLFIPIIVSALIESAHRGAIMEQRGFGYSTLRFPERWNTDYLRFKTTDLLLPAISPITLILIRAAS